MALKADPEKRKFRHHWQNVGKKLEAAAARYGSGPHAVEALTLASQTYEELSKFSGNKEDVEASERMAKKAKELGSDASKKRERKRSCAAAAAGRADFCEQDEGLHVRRREGGQQGERDLDARESQREVE